MTGHGIHNIAGRGKSLLIYSHTASQVNSCERDENLLCVRARVCERERRVTNKKKIREQNLLRGINNSGPSGAKRRKKKLRRRLAYVYRCE